MDREEFDALMQEYGKKIDIMFNVKQLEQFYKYMELLIEWNKKINLTAIIEPKEIVLKHFIDSLTINKYIKDKKSVADIGTGAGFPGIPLKIYRPDLKITLVDSLNKRMNFLKEVSYETNLENIEIIHSRVEDFGRNKKYREQFDIVTARAVANLSTLSEYLLPLVKQNGKCICMKGSDIEEELEKSNKAIHILGGKLDKVDIFLLPNSDMVRNIVIINKVSNTPNKYPRKAGTPSKKPII